MSLTTADRKDSVTKVNGITFNVFFEVIIRTADKQLFLRRFSIGIPNGEEIITPDGLRLTEKYANLVYSRMDSALLAEKARHSSTYLVRPYGDYTLTVQDGFAYRSYPIGPRVTQPNDSYMLEWVVASPSITHQPATVAVSAAAV